MKFSKKKLISLAKITSDRFSSYTERKVAMKSIQSIQLSIPHIFSRIKDIQSLLIKSATESHMIAMISGDDKFFKICWYSLDLFLKTIIDIEHEDWILLSQLLDMQKGQKNINQRIIKDLVHLNWPVFVDKVENLAIDDDTDFSRLKSFLKKALMSQTVPYNQKLFSTHNTICYNQSDCKCCSTEIVSS